MGMINPAGLEMAPCRRWAMFLHHAQQHILYHLVTVQIFFISPQIAELNVRNYQIIALLTNETR